MRWLIELEGPMEEVLALRDLISDSEHVMRSVEIPRITCDCGCNGKFLEAHPDPESQYEVQVVRRLY